MPLDPSEVKFINKFLDRRLAAQRGWGVIRYFLLLVAIFMFATGCWMWMEVSKADDLLDWTFHPAATSRASTSPSATRPVTHAEFDKYLELESSMAQIYGRDAVMMGNVKLAGTIVGGVNCLVGFILFIEVVAHWNRHRRDTILIKLLREKCKDELAPPAK